MEKLIYTDQKISNNRTRAAKRILLSLITGVAAVQCFLSIFGISLEAGSWYKGGILSGLGCLWNRIGNSLLINDGLIVKEVAEASEECGLFILILMGIAAVLAWLILACENSLMLLIYPAAAALPMVITSQEPSLIWTVLLILCLMAVHLEIKKGEGLNLWQALYGIAVSVILIAAVSGGVTSDFFDKPKVIEKIDTAMEAAADSAYYGENLLSDGQVSGEERSKATGETALEVTMATPESTYLRGFVGEMYSSDGQWEALPEGAYSETKTLLYWLRKEGFNISGQIGQANGIIEKDPEENTFSIEVKDADSKYAYIPYELISFADEEGLLTWYGESYSNGNFGTMKSYGYTAAENSVKRWTDVTGKFFTTEKTEEINEYLKLESWYNEFVYQYYTYVSDNEKVLLSEYFGDQGKQNDGHIEYKTAINKINEYLEDNMIYTENPGLDDGEAGSIMEAFFADGKGYDTHYATAATLMFRYYGIPARYVEGYLITPDDVKDTDGDETIEIPDGNIHAWTEIYVDGIGWVPIEVSPEYKGIMEEADMSIGLSNESLKQEFEESHQKFKKLQEMESGKGEEDLNPVIRIIISVILLLVILLILIFAAVKAVKKVGQAMKRKEIFEYGPAKAAVSAMYEHMNKLGLDIHHDARMLGNKASYSRQEISDEERWIMYGYLKELKVEKRKNEKKKRKYK